jgi:hypothetical protein
MSWLNVPFPRRRRAVLVMRFKLVELVHHLHAVNRRDASRHGAGDLDGLAHLRLAHAHFVQRGGVGKYAIRTFQRIRHGQRDVNVMLLESIMPIRFSRTSHEIRPSYFCRYRRRQSDNHKACRKEKESGIDGKMFPFIIHLFVQLVCIMSFEPLGI